jgi:hypothetical protein
MTESGVQVMIGASRSTREVPVKETHAGQSIY